MNKFKISMNIFYMYVYVCTKKWPKKRDTKSRDS